MLLRRRMMPLLLPLSHGCIDFCQGAITALLPTLLVQRHLSYTATAGLVFAANIVSSIIQPAFGHLADRLRIPWLLPLSLLLAGGGLALATIFPQYWLIVLSMGICGIGIAAFHPEAARFTYEIAGRQRTIAMSFFSLGGNIGLALGPLVMTAVLAIAGLAGTSAILLPLLLVALLLLAFSNTSMAGDQENVQKKTGPAHKDNWWAFSRLTGAVLCRSIMLYGLNTFLVLYWINVLRQSQAVGGTALSVLLFSGLGGTLLGGTLADRYGRRRVVLLAFCLLFPLFFVFLLISPLNMFFAWLLLIPVGMCLFVPFSVMIVMGQGYLPEHVGTASGVTLGLAVTVGGIAAPVLGKVADLYGIAPALWGLACLPMLAIACVLTLPSDSERKSARELRE